MPERKISPVLKWAGGKTQILDHIVKNMPENYNNYYEPFIGSASVLFGISPKKAFINDNNPQLINLYMQLRVSAESVISIVNKMDDIPCSKELYYSIREHYNRKILNQDFDAESAALMIWINKHCFNGLYRVNSKGLFNVPYNNKVSGKSIDECNVRAISEYLQNSDITITCLDFEPACENISKGDFVYFDSPYVPKSTTASFTDYSSDGFTRSDHERLAILFKRLDSIGVKIMLSNNDVPLVRELYNGYHIQTLEVKRLINSDASKRRGTELLITNY